MKNRANPENCRLLNRKYMATDKGKAARQRAQVTYRQKHKKKAQAHGIVAYALKRGALIRQRCHICGSEESQAHHPDYDRPLDVVWLCDHHHKQAHEIAKPNNISAHVLAAAHMEVV